MAIAGHGAGIRHDIAGLNPPTAACSAGGHPLWHVYYLLWHIYCSLTCLGLRCHTIRGLHTAVQAAGHQLCPKSSLQSQLRDGDLQNVFPGKDKPSVRVLQAERAILSSPRARFYSVLPCRLAAKAPLDAEFLC